MINFLAQAKQVTLLEALPGLPPGESRYYLAAVNYQGQRRVGRQNVTGALQGRNAAELPGCR